jgi:hypothetical protein
MTTTLEEDQTYYTINVSSRYAKCLRRYKLVWIDRTGKGKPTFYANVGTYATAEEADGARAEHDAPLVKTRIAAMRLWNTS